MELEYGSLLARSKSWDTPSINRNLETIFVCDLAGPFRILLHIVNVPREMTLTTPYPVQKGVHHNATQSELMREVCHNVKVEPTLIPVDDDSIFATTTTTATGERSRPDVAGVGVWVGKRYDRHDKHYDRLYDNTFQLSIVHQQANRSGLFHSRKNKEKEIYYKIEYHVLFS